MRPSSAHRYLPLPHASFLAMAKASRSSPGAREPSRLLRTSPQIARPLTDNTSGWFVSVNTGGTPDGNAVPVPKTRLTFRMDAALASGASPVSRGAKTLRHAVVAGKSFSLNLLPKEEAEKERRPEHGHGQMDAEGFGNSHRDGSCEPLSQGNQPELIR